jgi:hypothetical protein
MYVMMFEVETHFVCSVLKSHFDDQNAVNMFVPEPGCFRVSL